MSTISPIVVSRSSASRSWGATWSSSNSPLGGSGTRKAATRGSLTGGVLGALIGWIFGLFNWVDPLVSGLGLALYGLVLGSVRVPFPAR